MLGGYFGNLIFAIIARMLCRNHLIILRGLNKGHLRSFDFKKLKLLKKRCARVHDFNFKCKFNPGDLFKVQSLIIRREIIGNSYLK